MPVNNKEWAEEIRGVKQAINDICELCRQQHRGCQTRCYVLPQVIVNHFRKEIQKKQ